VISTSEHGFQIDPCPVYRRLGAARTLRIVLAQVDQFLFELSGKSGPVKALLIDEVR